MSYQEQEHRNENIQRHRAKIRVEKCKTFEVDPWRLQKMTVKNAFKS